MKTVMANRKLDDGKSKQKKMEILKSSQPHNLADDDPPGPSSTVATAPDAAPPGSSAAAARPNAMGIVIGDQQNETSSTQNAQALCIVGIVFIGR